MKDDKDPEIQFGFQDNAELISISWYTNVAKFRKIVFAIGICERTGGVSHLAIYSPGKQIGSEFIKTQTIRNVIVSDTCEDACSCLNLDCSLNKAGMSYWKNKYSIETTEHLQYLHDVVEEIKTKLQLKPHEPGIITHFQETPILLEINKGSLK